MLTLDVLIATHTPEGILRVADMNLPVVEGVRYIVSWQDHREAEIPPALDARNDVTVDRFGQRGVSFNRNNAIELSTADVYLVADDDLRYTPSQLEAVRQVFENNPDLDYASFMYEGTGKIYPSEECRLGRRLPKGFYQTSFEVAVRRRGRAALLRFHPAFGPGSISLHAAEDEMFLLTARRMKLNCRFFPIVITRHEGMTTGQREITEPGVLRAFGAFIYYCYPLTFIPRIPLKAWRLSKSGQSRFLPALRDMLCGVAFAFDNVTPLWREVRR